MLSSAYAITDLGAGEATAINASGQVVGEVITSEGYENAFLYSNGSIRNLGTLPNLDSSNATGINDRGEVVGYAYQKDIYSDFEPYAFVDDNGVMTALGVSNPDPFMYTDATGINDNGQILGNVVNYNGASVEAFVYANGGATSLGALPGYNDSIADGINNSGQIVGGSYNIGSSQFEHAFLYSSGSMLDLGTLPGYESSEARALNDSGQIVGLSGPTESFLYSNGRMTDLGYMGFPNAINDNGQVVGGGSGEAFLYSNGTTIDLDALIPSNSGWTLLNATGINDKGQICGNGFSPDGTVHAFLLTPTGNVPNLSGQFTGAIPIAATFGELISPALQITDAVSAEDVVDGNETTDYYLSTTPNLSGIITPDLATNNYTLHLTAGSSFTESRQVTIPQNVTPGTYYLVAQIDANQAINPTDTDNFVASGPIQVAPPALSGKFTGTMPPSAALGATISPALQITDAAGDQGVANGVETTAYYLSTTPNLTGTTTLLDTNTYTMNLNAGASTTESQNVEIPIDTKPGTYYLVAQIDADGAIEGQPGAVVASAAIKVGLPVLSGIFTSTIPSTAEAGDMISPVLQITDAAGVDGVVNGTETTIYYLSTTPDLTGIIMPALATNSYTFSLSAGSSASESHQVTVPQNLTSGTYYLVAQIDAKQAINPTYTDIYAASGPIQVGVATQLVFDPNQQPTDTMADYSTGEGDFADPIAVDVEDASGELVTTDNSSVTMGTASSDGGTGPNGITLGGTETVQVHNGVATFNDLAVNVAAGFDGADLALQATDNSLTSATSNTFTVTTLLDLANLSSSVYSNKTPISGSYSLLPGEYLTGIEVPGFAAGAYANAAHTQIVIAFRGTELGESTVTSLENLAADASFRGTTATMSLAALVNDAVGFLNQVNNLAKTIYPNATITLTGHSLGGALAQLLGRASSLATYAFNAPGGGADI